MVSLKTIILGSTFAGITLSQTTSTRTSTRTSTSRTSTTTSCHAHVDYWACSTTFTLNLCTSPTPSARYPPIVPTAVANRCSSLGIPLPSGWSTAYPDPTATITTSGPAPTQNKWGQCGGIGHTGPTICATDATCTTMNPYYAQCI
ncbi:Endoglucanase-4 [Dactylella cylindrospora]|nr:Endoglucanase-4 [Dactylella cylindrospora]